MTPDELRRRRETMSLSQSELAAILQVASNTIARWERGERAIPSMLGLALQAIEQTIAAEREE